MSAATEAFTFTIPRSVISELPALTCELQDRMHDLLERNTEGSLTPAERAELASLVRMAQFAQIFALAAHGASGV